MRPAPPELVGLWRAAGGHTGAGVSFSYRVRFSDGEEISLAEVALRFDDFQHLWVRSAPGDPLARIALDDPSGELDPFLVEAAGARARGLDFALRSIRLFFSVPLTSSRGPWEYRTLLGPSLYWGEPQLEVVFRGSLDPHGACFVELESDPRTLRRIVYAGRHPFAPSGPSYATFSEYEDVEGVPIAARRVHRELTPPPHARDPFPELGRTPNPVFLEETVRAVRFLSAAATEVLLPLPLEKEDTEVEPAEEPPVGETTP